jgi:hypothetical protein
LTFAVFAKNLKKLAIRGIGIGQMTEEIKIVSSLPLELKIDAEYFRPKFKALLDTYLKDKMVKECLLDDLIEELDK